MHYFNQYGREGWDGQCIVGKYFTTQVELNQESLVDMFGQKLMISYNHIHQVDLYIINRRYKFSFSNNVNYIDKVEYEVAPLNECEVMLKSLYLSL